MKIKFTKLEKSWILYDWANSVYAVVILAAIFPIYATQVCAAGGVDGDYWWSVSSAVSTAIIAVMTPILGALGDYRNCKKKLFRAMLLIGLVFTAVCAFVDSWQLLLLGYGFSYIGWAGANMYYDSMLTDVTTRERMDTVSAWGYSMGYIGGSTIPFLACIGLITAGGAWGIDGTMAVKISVWITVLWWAIFSIPLLRDYQQDYGKDMESTQLVHQTFGSLAKTLRKILQNRGMFLYILAYFFYIDGVNTVIKMSTAYGSAIGLDSTGMILALLVTQIVAVGFAIWFGRLANRFGTIRIMLIAIGMYTFICILAFYMGFGLEEGFLSLTAATGIFWAIAFLVGSVQGGIQALSRSYFGKMVPKEQSNEYFGLFDIFGKFSCVIGPTLYAVTKATTGRSSYAVVSIIVLFILGGATLFYGRKDIAKAVLTEGACD